MNDATLDRWMTMRMLTPEVGELDVDGYRISVVERPVAKFDEMDPDFEYVLRITKLHVKDTSHDDHRDSLSQWIVADAAAAKVGTTRVAYHGSEKVRADENLRKPAPKRKAVRPKGKAK